MESHFKQFIKARNVFKNKEITIMKQFLGLLFYVTLLVSCKSEISKEQKKAISENGAYAQSVGRLNHLTILMDNYLWEGKVGDEVRKIMASGVEGLPQDEPLFTIKQMPKSAFKGFVSKSRCYLSFTTGKEKAFTFSKNKYARPQIGLHISGYTEEEVIANFLEHKTEIIDTFKETEIIRRQSVIKTPRKLENLEKNFGYNLRIPNTYRVAKETDSFIWLRKNIPQGSLNLTLYNVSKAIFKDSLSIVQNVIALRNKIGGDNIPVNENGRFITEEAFSPFFRNVQISNKRAFETRGTWEVKNQYMAGPFINYVIDDTNNNQFIVLEGFVFAPTIMKRDYIFELESIIKTIRFK